MMDIQKRVFPDYIMPNFVISCSIVALLERINTLLLFWDLIYVDTSNYL